MRILSSTVVLILASLLWLCPASARVEPDSAEIGEMARHIVGRDEYQKELTRRENESQDDWDWSPPKSVGCDWSGSPFPDDTVGFTRVFFLLVGCVALGIGVLWALTRLREYLASRSRDRKGDEDEETKAPWHEASSERVEALASRAQWGEAAHELLLLTVRRLTEKKGKQPAASLTARELRGVLAEPGRPRELFGFLVHAVELSVFGGREMDEAEFVRCREVHDELLSLGGRVGEAGGAT